MVELDADPETGKVDAIIGERSLRVDSTGAFSRANNNSIPRGLSADVVFADDFNDVGLTSPYTLWNHL